MAMNLLMIIVDSFRKDHCGFMGNDWIHTPNLDALAEESLVFTEAIPESMPTLPVRRALHTGKRTYPFLDWKPEKGDRVLVWGWQRIPEEQITLAEALNRAGYTTGFVTDTYHQFKPSRNYHRGFTNWTWVRGQEADPWLPVGRRVSQADIEAHTPEMAPVPGWLAQYLANVSWRQREEDYFAPRVFLTAMGFLESFREQQPFFLLVDSFDPHEPWEAPKWYLELYADPDYRGRDVITSVYGRIDKLTEGELAWLRARYAAECTMVDKWIGHLMNKLDDLGLADNTLVMVVSDHGHAMGEHGVMGKVPREQYPELVDIPMLIRTPDRQLAGVRSDAFVYNVDLVATAYEALGVEPPMELDGIDLMAVGRGDMEGRPWLTCAFNDCISYRDREWAMLIRGSGADPLLFHLPEDPGWNNDVAAEHPDVVRELYARCLEDAGGEFPHYEDIRHSDTGEWYRL